MIRLQRLKFWDNFLVQYSVSNVQSQLFLYIHFDSNDDKRWSVNNHTLDLLVSFAVFLIERLYIMMKKHLKDKNPLTWSNRPFARSGHMVQNHTCW